MSSVRKNTSVKLHTPVIPIIYLCVSSGYPLVREVLCVPCCIEHTCIFHIFCLLRRENFLQRTKSQVGSVSLFFVGTRQALSLEGNTRRGQEQWLWGERKMEQLMGI